MKPNHFFFISLFFVLITLSAFTSCTNSDGIMGVAPSDSFENIKNRYGIQEVSNSAINECSAISVSTADMSAVLEILRQNSSHIKDCIVESKDNSSFKKHEKEYIKKIIMAEQYKSVILSEDILTDFALRVELSFNIDHNQVYYLGTDHLYTSDFFEWRANGLSLYPSKDSNGYTYKFESESFLFFKLSDQVNILVKVPIAFKGKYDFESGKGTYRFELQTYN